MFDDPQQALVAGLAVGLLILCLLVRPARYWLRHQSYRRKHPDLMMDTLVEAGNWEIGRTRDGKHFMLLAWGKSETIRTEDVLGYKLEQQQVPLSPRRRDDSGKTIAMINLELEGGGFYPLFHGDGNVAEGIGVSLNKIGIRCLSRTTVFREA